VCEPLYGEPDIRTLPRGDEVYSLIVRIAGELEFDPCPYAAKFAINAAKVLGGRAGQMGDVVATDRAIFLEDLSVATTDDAGNVVWQPVPSPSIQLLRQLGRVVPLLDELYRLIVEVLFPVSDLIPAGYFIRDFNHEMESSIIWIYLYACQISLLQLLTASRENIEARRSPENFPRYVDLTKVMISTIAADQVELLRLRDALKSFHDKGARLDKGEEVHVFSRDPEFSATWVEYWDVDHEIRVGLAPRSSEEAIERQERWVRVYEAMEALKAREDLRFRLFDLDHMVRNRATSPRLGYITKGTDGIWRIPDGKGTEWTVDDLNKAIQIRQSYIESTDPILKHIRFGKDVPFLAADLSRVEPFLRNLLEEMLAKNSEVRSNTLEDPKWAFEHSKIEKPKGAHSYFGNQSGLHGMAELALHDAFAGTSRYGLSLERLYSHQVGWCSLRDTFLFVGIVALSILCPPLGLIAGIVEAVWRYDEAEDLETLYGALLDPGVDVISRAEVEAQMFCARLGLALSFIPVAGKITSVATRGIKAAVSQGFRAGARAALRAEMDDLAKSLTVQLGPGLAAQVATIPLMMQVMESILDPVIEDVIRQVEVAMPVALPESEEALVAPEDDN
jgi:hypothetical protein